MIYRVFSDGAVAICNGFSVAFTVGEVDCEAAIFESIDFASFVFEEVFDFIVFVVAGSMLVDGLLIAG